MTATEIKLIKSIKPQINRETHHKMFQNFLHTTRLFLISRVLARSSVIISLSYLSMSTNVYLMHFCQITGARWHIHKYMVLVCSKKAFYSKVLTDFVLRGWLGTCKFGKIQNVRNLELSELALTNHWKKISFGTVCVYIHIYIYIYI